MNIKNELLEFSFSSNNKSLRKYKNISLEESKDLFF